MECKSYPINDIVDLKRLLNSGCFNRYIVALGKSAKRTFCFAKAYLNPNAVCFKDSNGESLCLDNVMSVKGDDNSVTIYTDDKHKKYIMSMQNIVDLSNTVD